uniref:SUEL-type lectin domain-containing protein n=1 Tax=Takifugu rubripes TaxID=31033 RepID=A0A674NLU9_TAKRU
MMMIIVIVIIIIINNNNHRQCQRFVLRKPSLSISEKGVISVQAALYGRADTDTCSEGRPVGQLTNTTCSQPGTEDLVKTRCDGKKECEINIRDVATPDPCVGTFKYLDTNYTCLPASQSTGSLAHLFCAEGQVISVYGADYGRRDETTCSYRRFSFQTRNTLCSGPTNKVAELYAYKTCWFQHTDVATPDPCVGTFKYLDTNYTCLPAIHVVNVTLISLLCFPPSAEGQVISVYGADYGRRDETTCSYRRFSFQTRNTLCSGPTNKVAECNGKNRCTFRVGSSLFGDPCRNTYKYLELAYVCEFVTILL